MCIAANWLQRAYLRVERAEQWEGADAEVFDRYRSAGAGSSDAIRLHVTTHTAPLGRSAPGDAGEGRR